MAMTFGVFALPEEVSLRYGAAISSAAFAEYQLDTSHKSQDASVFAVGFDRTERIDSDMHRCHSHNRRIDHDPEGSKTDGGTS